MIVSVQCATTETTDVKRTKTRERETYIYDVVFKLDVKAVARQSDDDLLGRLHVLHALAVQHREWDLHTPVTQPHPMIKTESSERRT